MHMPLRHGSVYHRYIQRCQITFTRATYQHLDFFPLPLTAFVSFPHLSLSCLRCVYIFTGFIEL